MQKSTPGTNGGEIVHVISHIGGLRDFNLACEITIWSARSQSGLDWILERHTCYYTVQMFRQRARRGKGTLRTLETNVMAKKQNTHTHTHTYREKTLNTINSTPAAQRTRERKEPTQKTVCT